jgi:hypothetical protein
MSASAHALAENHISQRHRKKQNRYRKKDSILHHKSPQP